MAAISNSVLAVGNHPVHLSPASSWKQARNMNSSMLFCKTIYMRKGGISSWKRPLVVQAGYSESGKTGGASIFIGGFILGGIIVGTLGCVYAPQISKTMTGAEGKDLMRKLPKFIYDEEKALEKTRQRLTEKIDQLNSAIDEVSAQLKSEDTPKRAPVRTDEVQSAI